MSELSMTFNNFTDATFQRSAMGNQNAFLDNTEVLPGPTLGPNDTQVYAVDNSFIGGEAVADFWCCWFSPNTRARFGVRIQASGQPFGLGWQPTWQVMSDVADINAAPQWKDSGSEPAERYEWDRSVGFRVIAEPVAGHETLNITILISNL